MSTPTPNQANAHEGIVEKIRNLFKMANPENGATQNEMEVAMRKAKELMVKHQIELIDLEDKPADAIVEEFIDTERKKRDEDRWIPVVIRKVFGVRPLYCKRWDRSVGRSGGYRHVYIFIGDPEDVKIAKVALPVIYNAMKNGLNEYLRINGIKWNTHTANSFFRGVADGFIKESVHGQAAAMKQFRKDQQDRFAIVLANKETRIQKFIDSNMRIKSTKDRSRATIDHVAFASGKVAGASIDLTTKIN